MISNNQNKRNQNVSFKAGEGESLVGLEMQKVCSVLSELKIPYAVDKDDNEGLLIIDTSTLAKVIEKKDEIVKKMGKEINFYDYVGTINGNVKIPSYSNIDLGNVHTINGDLTMKGDFTDGNTRCNAKKLTYINGSLLLEFKNILDAPLLKRIEKDCKMIDSYLTSSNLEYVGGDMYLTGDHLSYLYNGNHRDFSKLRHAKSIEYMNVSPKFSLSLLDCNSIKKRVQECHTDDFYEDD